MISAMAAVTGSLGTEANMVTASLTVNAGDPTSGLALSSGVRGIRAVKAGKR